ncbi:alpha/beta hydrolase family protein [Spirosoma utsteinense]|uniref:Pimeloyl-ACP methyl ester carboxylesterase n=2 Tax=Spirosoma utsteinense TaxID=2585773 RepID=A0ABR6WB80_9BACT|nr:prolyl oligopeptidase family serine peptidase [Spirosoma utsteinense]MBC3793835.1 pimeloyl-ACP methyl ester carboxylesterase [Spirosoma utsteinense]
MITPGKLIRFLWIIWFVTACSQTDTTLDPTTQNQYLVGSTQLAQLTKEQTLAQLKQDATLFGGVSPDLFVQNGCTVYRLTYRTKNVDGSDITASGALLVPTKTGPLSLISIQHGTIFDETLAPSYYAPGTEAYTMGTLGAALGYLIAYPDYIGYGESKQVLHPYEHRKTLASSSYDMLLAVREFCQQKSIGWNNNLYLSGYSQGGGATMGLQQKIESESPMAFALKGVSCGAGAYDKTSFSKFLLGNPSSGLPVANSQYIWVMQTYNRIYGFNRPLSFYLKEPYATQVQSQGTAATINVSLHLALTDTFRAGILNGTDTEYLNALKENDIYNFVPKTPTLLIHGTDDKQVYFLNSQNAFDAMKKQGALSVQLVPLPGKAHDTSIPDYLVKTLQFFSTLQ